MKENTNGKEEEPREPSKGISMRWILYSILAYALFQTFYLWWQVNSE